MVRGWGKLRLSRPMTQLALEALNRKGLKPWSTSLPESLRRLQFVSSWTKLGARLPTGVAGDAAIYTPHVPVAHIIRKAIPRQLAIVNYVNPF